MSDLATRPKPDRSLEELEAVIERGIATFVEVGQALLEIRDRRLYRERGYARFEDYCQKRWGFSDSRARQLIGAAETVTTVTVGNLPPPANEAQARELASLKDDPETLRAVWEETLRRTGGHPTAAAVAEVREELAPRSLDPGDDAMHRTSSPPAVRPERGRPGPTLKQTLEALKSLRIQIEGAETLFLSGRLDRIGELFGEEAAQEEFLGLAQAAPLVISRLRRLIRDWRDDR